MKLYLKIFLATVLGSIVSGTLIVGVRVGLDGNDAMGLIFAASVIGFVHFGVSGSIFWYLIYSNIFSKKRIGIQGHLPSVLISSILSAILLMLLNPMIHHGWRITQLTKYLIPIQQLKLSYNLRTVIELIILAVPSAFICLLIYWLIFLNGRTNLNKNLVQDNNTN